MGGIKDTQPVFEGISKAVDNAKDSVELLTESIVEGGREFELMTNAVNSSVASLNSVGNAMRLIGSDIPILEQLGGAISIGTNAITGLVGSITELSTTFYEGMGALDAMSAGHRALYEEMFRAGSQFGKTFEESKKFADGILVVASAVNNADFGWLKSENLIETANLLANARVSVDMFSNTIESSAGRMDLLTAATLQSISSGLTTADYFNNLSDAILKQGLSSEEAMKQLSSFKDISESTGISVSSVASSLNSLGNSFSRIGLSADFGRPMVKSFADTIKDMGLGIENATELASSLSTSLGSLATDYSMMYITAQRGNMQDMMGGGALNAGFQFQSKLLDAEGDPEAQAKLGQEMMMALKDTISSFGGGEITTAREAAANPELAVQAYTQQKLLEQMYNLDDKTALRTLDLLDQLGQAVTSGDVGLAESLGEDLQTAINVNNQTMDLQDKANAFLSGILSEAMVTNEAIFLIGRETLGNSMLSEITDGAEKALKTLSTAVDDNRRMLDEQLNKGRSGEFSFGESLKSIAEKIVGIKEEVQDDGKAGGVDGLTRADDIYSKINALIDSNTITSSLVNQLLSAYSTGIASSSARAGVLPGTVGATSN